MVLSLVPCTDIFASLCMLYMCYILCAHSKKWVIWIHGITIFIFLRYAIIVHLFRNLSSQLSLYPIHTIFYAWNNNEPTCGSLQNTPLTTLSPLKNIRAHIVIPFLSPSSWWQWQHLPTSKRLRPRGEGTHGSGRKVTTVGQGPATDDEARSNDRALRIWETVDGSLDAADGAKRRLVRVVSICGEVHHLQQCFSHGTIELLGEARALLPWGGVAKLLAWLYI